MDSNFAISVSRDHKWIVCGTCEPEGASVWDAEVHAKAITVEGGNQVTSVASVDVSPDSTRFATGTERAGVSIWSIGMARIRQGNPFHHISRMDVFWLRYRRWDPLIYHRIPYNTHRYHSEHHHSRLTTAISLEHVTLSGVLHPFLAHQSL